MQTNVHFEVLTELVRRGRTNTASLRLYCIYCKEGRDKGNKIMYLGIFIITFYIYIYIHTHSHTHTHINTVGRDMEVRKFIANTNYAVFRSTMYT